MIFSKGSGMRTSWRRLEHASQVHSPRTAEGTTMVSRVMWHPTIPKLEIQSTPIAPAQCIPCTQIWDPEGPEDRNTWEASEASQVRVNCISSGSETMSVYRFWRYHHLWTIPYHATVMWGTKMPANRWILHPKTLQSIWEIKYKKIGLNKAW